MLTQKVYNESIDYCGFCCCVACGRVVFVALFLRRVQFLLHVRLFVDFNDYDYVLRLALILLVCLATFSSMF